MNIQSTQAICIEFVVLEPVGTLFDERFSLAYFFLVLMNSMHYIK